VGARCLVGKVVGLLIITEPDEVIIAMGCGQLPDAGGIAAVIEDVVWGAFSSRGGKPPLRRLLELARDQGALGVVLTSNARRVAANRLYLRVGFRRRRTNSYFYGLV
jgi:hypothetical protein